MSFHLALALAAFVADDMMAPLEGTVQSKQGWIRQHRELGATDRIVRKVQ